MRAHHPRFHAGFPPWVVLAGPSSSVSTRRSRRVPPLARPSRGRSASSSSSPPPCEHGGCASVDSSLPKGTDAGARTPGPRSPKTRGEARDSLDGASPRGGAPFVATRHIRAGAFRPVTGTLEERRSMTGEDPDSTAPTIARATGQILRLPSPPAIDPRVSHRRLLKPSPGCIPRRVGLGHLQPTFFRFSKTCTRLVPHALPDPRGGRVKPRVTPRWPRFGSNVPLSGPGRTRLERLSPPQQGRSPR